MECEYPYKVYSTKPETSVEITTPIYDAINECKNCRSKIGIDGIGNCSEENGYRGVEVYLHGGLNGCGEWEDYFMDLSKVIATLKAKFNGKCERVSVQELNNDMCDDIFYVVVDITFQYANK